WRADVCSSDLLACCQVQVDDGRVLVGTNVALVDTHRPQAQGRPGAAEGERRRDDRLAREAGERRAPLGRIALDDGGKLLPARRALRDEAPVEEPFVP